jgi:hypothetical protein
VVWVFAYLMVIMVIGNIKKVLCTWCLVWSSFDGFTQIVDNGDYHRHTRKSILRSDKILISKDVYKRDHFIYLSDSGHRLITKDEIYTTQYQIMSFLRTKHPHTDGYSILSLYKKVKELTIIKDLTYLPN